LGITNLQIINSSGREAQQDVFHVHFHIVPRYEGDGQNVVWKTHPEWIDKFDQMVDRIINKECAMLKYFFIILIVLLQSACASTVPQETTPTFRFGVPVESESNARIASLSGLRASFDYSEPLTVVKVEQMSWGEYGKFVGTSNPRPADMQVWLVIYYDDELQAHSPMPGVTPAPSFQGCVFVAINAADGTPLETGGPLQSGKIPACDK
jgi:hypothetical protein